MFFWLTGLILIFLASAIHALYRKISPTVGWSSTVCKPSLSFGRGGIVMLCWIFICIVVHCIFWYNQMWSYEEITRLKMVREQRQTIIDTRLPQFKQMLLSDYPNYEQNTLSAFKSLNGTILRSSDAMNTFTLEVDKATEWIQTADEVITAQEREITVMKRNPFIIKRFLPEH